MDEKKLRYYHSLYEVVAALNSADTADCILSAIAESAFNNHNVTF